MILLPAVPKPKRMLEDIFTEEDDLGLLVVEPLKVRTPSGDLFLSQFEEIIAFYKRNSRPPYPDAENIEEMRLARRLLAFRANAEQCNTLSQRDIYNLLSHVESTGIDNKSQVASASELPNMPTAPPITMPMIDKSELVKSLDDIFDDDDGLLTFETPEIFTLKHVPAEKKSQPDEIAKRQPCPDFPRFAPIFEIVQKGIKSGTFSFARFRHELGIQEGDFFILNGIMGYVYRAGERLKGYDSYNARLHLVFENGTELNMLFQSLTHGLVRDNEGRKVLLNGEHLLPGDMPIPTGLVYVLATQSTQQALIPYKHNLYKVGFTEGTVEERIWNAEKDKTFLEAPVRIVMTTQCYNINAQKLESLVHGFLGMQRLSITLKGYDGHVYSPREWFYAPLATVLSVIQYILDGTISQYRMDNTSGKIVLK